MARVAVRAPLLPLILVGALGACETAPTSSNPGDQVRVVHPGDAAVTVVGTPFYLAFKAVTCAAGTVIAAPLAGIAALSESPFAPEIQQELGDGIAQNCGPPYALSPYREVSVKPPAEVREPPAPEPPTATPPADPVMPRSSDRPSDIPQTSMPAPTGPSREDSTGPLTEEVQRPAADGPIQLFKM